MAYKLVRLSALSGKHTTYSVVSSDVIYTTLGTLNFTPGSTTPLLSSIKLTMDELAQFLFTDPSNTYSMWVSGYNTSSSTGQITLRQPDFNIGLGGSPGTGKLYVDGNVGIGTTNPADALHIYGGASTSSIILQQAGDTTHAVWNYNAGADSTFGTVAHDGLQFFTNNTIRTTIKADGNVGIGTTDPATKLHVAAGHITIDNSYALMFEDGNNLIGGSGSSGTNYLNFNTNGTERMRIIADGNVGIGTASPDKNLHIYDGSESASILLETDAADKWAFVRLDGGTSRWDIATRQDQYSEALQFRENGQDNPGVVFAAGGNVGIGTTLPKKTLDVRGEFLLDNVALFEADGSDNSINIGSEGDFRVGDLNWSSNSGDIDSYKFVVKNNGNVGIGTTTPDTHLDIEKDDPSIRFTHTAGGYSELIQGNATFYLDIDKGNTVTGSSLQIRMDGGATKVTVKNDGDVGIGNESPAYKLEVSGDIRANDGWLRTTGTKGWYNDTYGVGIQARDSTFVGTYPTTKYFRAQHIYQDSPGGYCASINGTLATNYIPKADSAYRITESLIYDNGTNVTIGGTESAYKLEVNGDIRADGGWLRTNGSRGWYNDSYGLGLYAVDTTWLRVYPSSKYLRAQHLYQDGAGGYCVSTNSTMATNYIQKADSAYRVNDSQIYDNGTNVAIGHTNPTEKLHVDGRLYASGVKFADGSIQTTAAPSPKTVHYVDVYSHSYTSGGSPSTAMINYAKTQISPPTGMVVMMRWRRYYGYYCGNGGCTHDSANLALFNISGTTWTFTGSI
jgi:hypothetical protein